MKEGVSNEELVRRYQEGDKKSLDELIERNTEYMYFVIKNLKHNPMNPKYLDEDDIFELAVEGYIKAAQRYDFVKYDKCKFSTFAFTVMRHHIWNELYGSHKAAKNNKFYNEMVSLNSLCNDEKNSDELIDFVEDKAAAESFENIIEEEHKRALAIETRQALIDNLTLLERELIRLRYGFDCEPLDRDTTAEVLKIDKKDERKIEYGSICKLRKSTFGRKYIDIYLEEHVLHIESSYRKIEIEDYLEDLLKVN